MPSDTFSAYDHLNDFLSEFNLLLTSRLRALESEIGDDKLRSLVEEAYPEVLWNGAKFQKNMLALMQRIAENTINDAINSTNLSPSSFFMRETTHSSLIYDRLIGFIKTEEEVRESFAVLELDPGSHLRYRYARIVGLIMRWCMMEALYSVYVCYSYLPNPEEVRFSGSPFAKYTNDNKFKMMMTIVYYYIQDSKKYKSSLSKMTNKTYIIEHAADWLSKNHKRLGLDSPEGYGSSWMIKVIRSYMSKHCDEGYQDGDWRLWEQLSQRYMHDLRLLD